MLFTKKIFFIHYNAIVGLLIFLFFSKPIFAIDLNEIISTKIISDEIISVDNQSSQKIIVTSPINLSIAPMQKKQDTIILSLQAPPRSTGTSDTLISIFSALDNKPVCSIKQSIPFSTDWLGLIIKSEFKLTIDNKEKCEVKAIMYPSNHKVVLDVLIH